MFYFDRSITEKNDVQILYQASNFYIVAFIEELSHCKDTWIIDIRMGLPSPIAGKEKEWAELKGIKFQCSCPLEQTQNL
jgi:hypothetical protein